MQKPVLIPLAQLRPSATNPRKIFDPAKLKELAANLQQHGVLQSLLVRPEWCQGCKTQAELAAKRPPQWEITPPERRFVNVERAGEVVDGERRMRAALLHNETGGADGMPFALIEALPCDVRELTDTQVVEIQLITFIQKEPLTPMEEARGFADLLKLKGENGEPLHTRETIARTVGREENYVHKRLKMLALPEVAATALETGVIGTAVAVLIARIPGKEQRAEAAKKIVGGGRGAEPMTSREAEQYVAENFMVELKGAPFDTSDAELDKAAGSCAACPHRTGNNKMLYPDIKRGDICTSPGCYRGKCRAVFARVSGEAAKGGAKVLSEKDTPSIFEHFNGGAKLRYDSPYVDFFEKPAEGFVRHEVDRAKLPTWERLTEGQKVPTVVVPDFSGRARTLVDRKLAIEAAKANGEDIFVSGLGGGRTSSSPAEAAQRKAENAAQKKQMAIAVASSAAVRKAIFQSEAGIDIVLSAAKGPKLLPIRQDAVEPLLDLVLNAVGADAVWFLLKALEVKKPVNETTEQTFRKVLQKITVPRERLAIAIELLCAQDLRFNGVRKNKPFAELAAAYGVDLAAIESEVAAELKTGHRKPETGKAGPAKAPAPAKAPEFVRGSVKIKTPPDLKYVPRQAIKAKKVGGRAVVTDETRCEVKRLVNEGRTGAEIAKAVGISLPTVQNIKKALGLVKR